jgi:hypothetical protein
MTPVDDKLVDFLKTSFVQKVIDPFSGGHFSLGVLVIDFVLASAYFRLEVPLLKGLNSIVNIHQETSSGVCAFSSLAFG